MTVPVITAAGHPRVARRGVPPTDRAAGAAAPKPFRGTVAGLAPWAARIPPPMCDPAAFFADPALNNQTLFTLAAAGYGAAEYGEVASAIDAAHRGGNSYEAYYRAFRSVGQQVSAFGRDAVASRNLAAARGAFLRAASYLAASLYVAIGTGHPRRQAAAYRAMDRNWALAAGLLDPAAEQVRIRSGRTILPGWLLRPPATAGQFAARRPTVIFTGEADTQHIGLYVYGAAEAVALGYNALLVDGPGQGSLLYLRGTGLRPDWEKVITPAVDYLQDRPDVDPRRIALVGWGLGGALAARAAALEHRLAALVLDPGVTDVLATLRLPAPLVDLAGSGHPGEADAAWAAIMPRLPASVRFAVTKAAHPFRQPALSALVREIARYSTEAWLPDVAAPTLVTQWGPDVAFPGQGRQAEHLLRCPRSLHEFSGPAGQLPPPHRRNQVIFDWLGRVL